MQKTILITGATDGIGFETAKLLYSQGHRLLLHGRSPDKLQATKKALSTLPGAGRIEGYLADLAHLSEVMSLGQAITEAHQRLDVVINNAGIFRSPDTCTADGLDLRFAVNTFAPYLLTRQLLPLLGPEARVINLSSAAQSPVNLDALVGRRQIPDQLEAYAQSKLALTMWSHGMAHAQKDRGPLLVAVNPGSLLATKMVKEGFGLPGKNLQVGAQILVQAALAEEFATASGRYFDNDIGRFAAPHPDALDLQKCEDVIQAIELVLVGKT
ncbi:SDR family NAD(P)-dependent oxidoreductase [Pseudomonas benzenivorans]|uniref:SDR family NAD(P)-dependent oxidoreductase n=1 Tax=Pseudomonas benzenivorans TaxID=556533 RepID=A0ABY5H7M8_9PSED|nr:SDR family NAD(P)-dependent oxidoreductase [Pseudomonas benzenivorans]UTW08079.1 SDR family NAD(P)-dependent oxidoreductase [Pseudomonas benzenivorans]